MNQQNIKNKVYDMIKSKKILQSEGDEILKKLELKNNIPSDEFNADFNYYKAYVLEKPGDINELHLKNIEIKNILDNEVQIEIKAFSLNFGDLLCVKGLYPTMPEYPFTPGFEVSGIVRAVGKNVTRVKPGDEAIALTSEAMGGHSTLLVTDEKMVVKKPKNISFEKAAAFPVVYMTMDVAFEKANVKKGDRVLIQTAAGGTGLISVQLSKLYGADIYATAGSQEKLDYLEKLGVKNLINYNEENFEEKIFELTNGQGIDVFINTLSGNWIQKGLDVLAFGGRYIELAMTGLKTSHKLDLSMLTSNQTFYSVDFRKILINNPNMAPYYLDRMAKALEEGKVNATIGKIFEFDDIKSAYKYLQDRKNIGKVVIRVEDKFKSYKSQMKKNEVINEYEERSSNVEDIAIIGMSGRFPKAANLKEYWNNLEEAIDCIEEVPRERWNIEEYYSSDESKIDKTYSRWGGFLKDVDKFDALFFNISGKEAELTDPQHRILLEESWNALEDAGYANEKISNKRCGVYVGAGSGDYQHIIDQENIDKEAHSFWGNSASILSARIAYFLNLRGASITIDTACSSSLVAIHLACKSILAGECELALAGGIYIANTPDFYIKSSNANMLSKDGKCKAFDDSADGFVYGEGAGAVVLKSLEKAIRDKDNIYAVIKGSEINQDGKSNGITAPSSVSQTELEKRLYDNLNINPSDISYIETHGTGTKLGDPIEIEALTNAFRYYTDEKQYCAIGSVKTNIGHSVSAAGIASLIKVALCIKNKKIPKLLHFERNNRFIDFENSPFYINNNEKEWNTRNGRRLAAISSFGFSGTNCHMLVEEFDEYRPIYKCKEECEIITLSAKTPKALRKLADKLLEWLESEGEKNFLRDIAYTLNVRKEKFNIRACFIVNNIEELKYQLKNYEYSDYIYKIDRNKISELEIETLEEEVKSIFEFVKIKDANLKDKNEKLNHIKHVYLSGYNVDFEDLYINKKVKVVSMPTYPFEGKCYWLPKASINPKYYLDGDIDILESFNNEKIVFKKTIYKNDFIAKDHIVNSRLIVPGVVHLELIQLALDKIDSTIKYEINQIIWLNPLDVTEANKDIVIILKKNNNTIDFEINSITDEKATLYSKGEAVKITSEKAYNIYDIDSIKNRCTLGVDKEKPYKKLEVMGIKYGKFFRGLNTIWKGKNEALAYISLPSTYIKDFNKYKLHPSIMDAALQATIGIVKTKEDSTALPFSLDKVEIRNNIEKNMYAYITNKNKGDLQFDITLMNCSGEVCVKLNNVSFREIRQKKEELIYVPSWEKNLSYNLNKKQECGKVLIIYPKWSLSLEEELLKLHKNQDVKLIEVSSNYDESEFYEIIKIYNDISTIYYLDGIIDINNEEIENYSDNRLLRLFNLVKILDKEGFARRKIDLKVITNNIYDIDLDFNEDLNYYSATLIGFTKSLSKEYSNWNVSLIDINIKENSQGFIANLAEKIYYENELEVVIRDDNRFNQVIKPIELNKLNNESLLRNNATYVIIGGAGGIGFEIAKHLINTYKAKIIILGRSDLSSNRINEIEKIEEKNGIIEYIKVDCTKEKEFEKAIHLIRKKYNKIDGIIHSAIVLEDMYIRNMSKENLQNVLKVKIQGTINIYKYLKEENLDFIMFFSSAQSFAGNAGQSNYAAGCTFEDIFASYLRKKINCPIKVVNWGFWGEVGIVANNKYNKNLSELGLMSLSVKDGISIIEDFMKLDLNQIIGIKAQKELLVKEGFKLQNKLKYFPCELKLDLKDILLNIKEDINSFEILYKFENEFEEMEKFTGELILNVIIKNSLLKNTYKLSQKELKKSLNIIPKYKRILEAFIDILVKEKKLERDNDNLILNNNIVLKDMNELSKDRDNLINKYDGLKNHINLIWNCFIYYKEILSGEIKATEVIFPNSDMNLVEGIYKGNIIADFCNEIVATSVEKYVSKVINLIPANKKIRILEIGAGTGGTSEFVMQKINKYKEKIEYDYTDISREFTNYGKNKFKDFVFVNYKVLNVEEDLNTQEYELQSYDIVIATNVLHATKNIDVTLKNIKLLLKNGGILLNNEATKAHYFTTFTFGLLDGWWLFEDEGNRLKNSPLLNRSKWQGRFIENGFYSSSIISSRMIANHDFGQDVFIAMNNGVVEENSITSKSSIKHIKNKKKVLEENNIEKKVKNKITSEELEINLNKKIKEVLVEVLSLEKEEIDDNTEYVQYGVDSLLAVKIVEGINTLLQINLNVTDLFNYSTVTNLTKHILDKYANNLHYLQDKNNDKAENKMENYVKDESAIYENRKLEIIQKVKHIIEEILHLEWDSMDIDTPYVNYGVDSLLSVNIIKKLNEVFKTNLRETDFFNYVTVSTLAEYINDNMISIDIECDKKEEKKLLKENVALEESWSDEEYNKDDIAIIGISGRFAEANNVDELWKNILEGVDSVKEIERWDTEDYYDENIEAENKSYSKYGGFIDEPYEFDPMFFNITPKEAISMDPQQRVFLQEAWKALEDAGYSDERLSGEKCGVFVGCGSGDYNVLLRENNALSNAYGFMGNSQSILAARISYFLNLRGASVSVDTACSSSLVALTIACESIKSGGSNNIALVGGVSVMNTPEFYIFASKAGMLSKTGKCKAFSDDADGFIPGEGCGVIVIKSLKEAIKDNDNIYGVISGYGTNQDGKTNGITAPSAPSQRDLEEEVYDKFNIDPKTITYVETHGTGTKLGDPIEIQALTEAFEKYTNMKTYCAIGSIKSNIGHALAASGIASIIKVLLAMKNKTIPKTLHAEVVNKYINLEESPFYVAKENKNWNPVNYNLRRAAISSFGFSGTNAHVILTEYKNHKKSTYDEQNNYDIITISAKTSEALEKKCEELLNYLKENKDVIKLKDIAYTSNYGRSHFSNRIAVIAKNNNELIENIESIVKKRTNSNVLRLNKDIKINKDYSKTRMCSEIVEKLVDSEFREENYDDLLLIAKYYIEGVNVDWRLLYSKRQNNIISLPQYPFERETYIVESIEKEDKNSRKISELIDENISTFMNERFSKLLNGAEFYLKDHIIENKKVMPGSAYIEMACEAVELASKNKVSKILNIKYLSPLYVIDKTRLEVDLTPIDEKEVSFVIKSRNIKYCIGTLILNEEIYIPRENLKNVVDNIQDNYQYILSKEECYKKFKEMGVNYGKSFVGIKTSYIDSSNRILTEIDSNQLKYSNEYILHPALLDMAFQTIINMGKNENLYLPYKIGEINISSTLEDMRYVYTTNNINKSNNEEKVFDIFILSDQKEIIVEIKDFTVRRFNKSIKKIEEEKIMDLLKAIKDRSLSIDEVVGELYGE